MLAYTRRLSDGSKFAGRRSRVTCMQILTAIEVVVRARCCMGSVTLQHAWIEEEKGRMVNEKKEEKKKEKEKEGEKERKKKLWHLAQLPFLAVPFSETLLVRDFLASSRFTRYLSALTPVERGEIQLRYRVSKRAVGRRDRWREGRRGNEDRN